MKKLFILMAITLIIGCKKDEDTVYYPSYSINAHIISSKNSFMLNGQNIPYSKVDFKFLEKYNGDYATLNLRSNPINIVDTAITYTQTVVFDSINNRYDTTSLISINPIYDTTYFKVVYTIKDEVIYSDSGYSTGYDLFISSWKVN